MLKRLDRILLLLIFSSFCFAAREYQVSKETLGYFDTISSEYADFNEGLHRQITEEVKKISASDFAVYENLISQFAEANAKMARIDEQLSVQYGTGINRDFLEDISQQTEDTIDYLEAVIAAFKKSKDLASPVLKGNLQKALEILQKERDFLDTVAGELQ